MNVLLTGGAGYIGSHVLRAVLAAGHNCIVYDSLIKGHAAAVESAGAQLILGDVADHRTLGRVLVDNEIDTVINFAAFIEAGESVDKPEKYFRNNTVKSLELLETMRISGVRRIVFSSTAAVYGTPEQTPIRETAPPAPINPYGSSKLCVEYMLQAYAQAHGMGAVALRYFNVAGADPSGDVGEDHTPETHLVPLVLQVSLGKRDNIKIFGDDYNTPDGTCVRDYIHIIDLAAAHIAGLSYLEGGGESGAFNLGNGKGYSVREVIETSERVVGASIKSEIAGRRAGDPDTLIADYSRAREVLCWTQDYGDLETIIRTAWAWHQSHPDGYED